MIQWAQWKETVAHRSVIILAVATMQTADQLFALFLASLLPFVTRFLINIDCKVEDLVFASSIVLVPMPQGSTSRSHKERLPT